MTPGAATRGSGHGTCCPHCTRQLGAAAFRWQLAGTLPSRTAADACVQLTPRATTALKLQRPALFPMAGPVESACKSRQRRQDTTQEVLCCLRGFVKPRLEHA